MRLNPFSRRPAASAPAAVEEPPEPEVVAPKPRTGNTFPADEVVWGIAIRNGFDELDDPWYHRGTTQHAYLEGNDSVSLCGYQPPRSGPRTRRRSRLGLPTPGDHPMCGICARMVVAPAHRTSVPVIPVPVNPARPRVAIPVAPAGVPPGPFSIPVARPPAGIPVAPAPAGIPVPSAPPASPGMPVGAADPRATPVPPPTVPPQGVRISPWLARAGHVPQPAPPTATPLQESDGGLLGRGVNVAAEDR